MKHIVISLMAALCGLIFTGCAGAGASGTESMLSASGFVARTPENAKQHELYDALPPYKVHRATAEGKVFYAYKDEKQGLAYVGDEAAYQRYQQLAVQKSIARDYYDAAEMNRETAWGWYGAYGPYLGPRPVIIRR